MNRWQANFGAVTIRIANECLEHWHEIGVVRILEKSLLKVIRQPGGINDRHQKGLVFGARCALVGKLCGQSENIVRALLYILDVLSRLNLGSVRALKFGDFNVVSALLLGNI